MSKNKIFFSCDVESTGQDPAQHNMYEFGVVPVLSSGEILDGRKFEVELISEINDNDTMNFLKKSQGITLHSLETRPAQMHPIDVMGLFDAFIDITLNQNDADTAIFVADNLAYDWSWINSYFHRFAGRNPFGYAGRNLPDISMGLYGSRNHYEQFRKTEHTHDGLDDALGNAEALSHMIRDGLKIE